MQFVKSGFSGKTIRNPQDTGKSRAKVLSSDLFSRIDKAGKIPPPPSEICHSTEG